MQVIIVPDNYPLYDPAQNKILAVVDTPNDEGKPQSWGWIVEGKIYVTQAGADWLAAKQEMAA